MLLDSESAVCSDDLKAAEDSAYQDDEFKSHGETHDDIRNDSDDDSDDDSNDDLVMDEGEDYDDDQQRPPNKPEQGTKRSNSAWTTGWKKYVYSMEEDESMSPRVRAIASKVAELLNQHQDEKSLSLPPRFCFWTSSPTQSAKSPITTRAETL